MLRRNFLRQIKYSAPLLVVPSSYIFSSVTKQFAHQRNDFVTTETLYGKLKGERINGVNVFKGIPYGDTVSGNNRFQRPEPPKAWAGVRNALEYGAPSIQPPRNNEPDPAEDCLFLNVWTPANDDKKRPVMFYNHGGGFVIGSGNSAWQDGANLARYFDVVVVQTNHRLGLLGFLYLDDLSGGELNGSGNNGLLDIALGLKWVHENIEAFGGDPENVMIFGESGGGAKTSCLYAMPEAAPFFNKASIESGPGVRMMTPDAAMSTTALVLKELNISAQNWRKIFDVPAADLLKVQNRIPSVPPSSRKRGKKESELRLGFGPVVDGNILPNHPFDPIAPEISKNKPLITGWNEDEFTFFAMQSRNTDFVGYKDDDLPAALEPSLGSDGKYLAEAYRKSRPNASAAEIYIAIQSIGMMGIGSVEIAEKKVEQGGAPVYLFNFGYKSEVTLEGTDFPIGTPHAMDIPFKFYNEVPPERGGKEKSYYAGSSPKRYIASWKMAELWTTFAKTGKPEAKDVPEWPAYNLKDRPTMKIDEECSIINDRFSAELAAWRKIGRL